METHALPHEIKLHICEYTGLKELKLLRQVSKSWASAGAQSLLSPTFNISSSKDIHRLIAIGRNPDLSRHAANTIRCLAFQTQGWNPRYFRNIVCNRHELRQNYEIRDFVPNEAELEALNELDNIIEQKDIDAQEDKAAEILVAALRVVPRVDSVKLLCGNVFTHRILRKTWEEYDLEAFSESGQQQTQLFRILTAAKDVGLSVSDATLFNTLLFDVTTLVLSVVFLWYILSGWSTPSIQLQFSSKPFLHWDSTDAIIRSSISNMSASYIASFCSLYPIRS